MYVTKISVLRRLFIAKTGWTLNVISSSVPLIYHETRNEHTILSFGQQNLAQWFIQLSDSDIGEESFKQTRNVWD
jgi:hypothetical protein